MFKYGNINLKPGFDDEWLFVVDIYHPICSGIPALYFLYHMDKKHGEIRKGAMGRDS